MSDECVRGSRMRRAGWPALPPLCMGDHTASTCLFFFQAEDGIRDVAVTGVQTCALPISKPAAAEARRKRQALLSDGPGALMAHPRPASWQWPWNSANAQATASPPHNWAQASRLFPPPPAPARVSSGPNRFSPAWYGLPPSRESPTPLAIPCPPPPSCLAAARFLPGRDPPRHSPAPPTARRE